MRGIGRIVMNEFSEPIVRYGDEVLRKVAEPLSGFDEEAKALLKRLFAALDESGIAVGVAAPQIGVSKRAFVYDIGEGAHAMINPVILSSSGEEYGVEGCLSAPGLQGQVPRAEKVTIEGINEEGEKVKISAEGFLARVFQHEIDHLDGKIFIDRADPDTLETVSLEEEKDAGL